LKLTNPVAVGDKVKLTIEKEEGTGLIKEILPRQNYVVRQSPRQKHNLHLLASNIDQAILYVTIAQPKLKQGFIDRFLLMTEPHNIPTFIVFNKADLYKEKDFEKYEAMKKIYEEIGYTTILASSVTKEGIDTIKSVLKDKITLVSGQSGVGKSTSLNVLQPSFELQTSEISDYSGKGQHTTTFAEMHTLDNGGNVIDTPGIKTLSFNNLEPMDVAHNFRELFLYSEDCKFHNCSHRNEPKCAVKNAIEEGWISELRYNNYLLILDEIEGQNYWERHKDM
jgi:ribosome biogenesis GTPase